MYVWQGFETPAEVARYEGMMDHLCHMVCELEGSLKAEHGTRHTHTHTHARTHTHLYLSISVPHGVRAGGLAQGRARYRRNLAPPVDIYVYISMYICV